MEMKVLMYILKFKYHNALFHSTKPLPDPMFSYHQ